MLVLPRALSMSGNCLDPDDRTSGYWVLSSRCIQHPAPAPSSYSFQNVLVNIAKTVIISSLPIIIRRLRTTLLSSGIFAKLPVGPTVPSPGPIAAIHVATELDAVTGSTPVKTTIIVPIKKRNRYKTTNERIEIFVFSADDLSV